MVCCVSSVVQAGSLACGLNVSQQTCRFAVPRPLFFLERMCVSREAVCCHASCCLAGRMAGLGSCPCRSMTGTVPLEWSQCVSEDTQPQGLCWLVSVAAGPQSTTMNGCFGASGPAACCLLQFVIPVRYGLTVGVWPFEATAVVHLFGLLILSLWLLLLAYVHIIYPTLAHPRVCCGSFTHSLQT